MSLVLDWVDIQLNMHISMCLYVIHILLNRKNLQLTIQLGILHMHRQSPTTRKSTIRKNVVFFEPLRHS